MATGRSVQQGRSGTVSNITPGADFRTGEAEVWQEAERVADRLAEAAKNDQLRRAQSLGAAEGVEAVETGALPSRGLMFFGDVAQARTTAMQAAYNARIRSDIDTREAELRRDNSLDPAEYERLSKEMISGFIQSAPPEYAVDVENYARARSSQGLERVADAASVAADREANQALTLRAGMLQERLIAIAADPSLGPESMEFMQAEVEYADVQGMREANPSILYSTEQRDFDDRKLGLAMTTAVVGRDAVAAYTAAGGGLPGMSAAQRFIADAMISEAFAVVTPEDRAAINRDLQTQISQFSLVDRAQAREAQEAARAADAARREVRGELSLQIVLGEVTEADIQARTDLNDADKAQLIRGIRSQQSQQATADRAAAALETAGRTAQYNTFRDDADAGTLTAQEIADALAAGQITPGQAQTLRTRNDRTLKPQVDDVMSVVRDVGERRRRLVPDYNARMARAEEGAADWVRANPNTTLEQRLTAGRWYADRAFGTQTPAPGAGGAGGGQTVAQRVAAVNARIEARRAAGNPYTTTEANRLRNEARQGR